MLSVVHCLHVVWFIFKGEGGPVVDERLASHCRVVAVEGVLRLLPLLHASAWQGPAQMLQS
jgi:hypothetical protein